MCGETLSFSLVFYSLGFSAVGQVLLFPMEALGRTHNLYVTLFKEDREKVTRATQLLLGRGQTEELINQICGATPFQEGVQRVEWIY